MKALISPNEIVRISETVNGQRIAQVMAADKIFPVAEPLYWMDCAPYVEADLYYFNGVEILQIPDSIDVYIQTSGLELTGNGINVQT